MTLPFFLNDNLSTFNKKKKKKNPRWMVAFYKIAFTRVFVKGIEFSPIF